ncbi:hypothetical protein [Tritonibacter scottomollicae]|uniref:Uncharacterized protein n=1 Tax=Tritonibacter scottomollicae TaxID=483013 RepID=A0A2T1ALN7_TRISK|nr:hypothetical protein [Tritonibacter scottomollicae]PRZ49525.1 hypothetical protein CLV89_102269 [Tritonibacter scottomollicae]
MMPFDAIISISGMLACLVGLFHVVIAYLRTTRSAEPDPERVRRFVESAPPIPGHLLYAHQDRCPEARPSRTEEAELGENDQKDHEAPR